MSQRKEHENQLLRWREEIQQDHAELQQYPDPSVTAIRLKLDSWMERRNKLAEHRAKIRAALHAARQEYEDKRAEVVTETSITDLGQGNYSAYEERECYYRLKLMKEIKQLKGAELILELYSEFIWDLDKMYTHWRDRRVDIKWEHDRFSEVSSGDYDN